ncbi:MAG: hypothetical protein ACK4TA_22640 [Saprospiraceae bacterium]
MSANPDSPTLENEVVPAIDVPEVTVSNAAKSWFSRENWQRFLFESALIVFSILLALLLNQWREYGKGATQRSKALGMIIKELEHNSTQLKRVAPYHQEVSALLDSISKVPVASSPMAGQTTLEVIAKPLRYGINPPELQTTAWRTAQLSGTVSLFDEATIYVLANVYELQEKGVEIMWREIAKIYLDPNSFDPAFTRRHVPVLRFYFLELYNQEVFLQARIQEAIDQLKQQEDKGMNNL